MVEIVLSDLLESFHERDEHILRESSVCGALLSLAVEGPWAPTLRELVLPTELQPSKDLELANLCQRFMTLSKPWCWFWLIVIEKVPLRV